MKLAGFIPALTALVFLSAASGREFKFKEVLLLTLFLSVLSVGHVYLGPRAAIPSDQQILTETVMEIFQNLIFGFSVALSLQNLLYCFLGCLLGTLIGVLPGIGPLATIAMLTPITFSISPVAALIMLAGIYYGAQYGGSTTAILVNLPGETSAVVTCIDGYQMARKGRAGPALAIAAIGSFFAGTVCTLIIALFGPSIAELALEFGPAEYFSLMLMGLVAAAMLAQGDMVKSLAMVVMGLLLGTVGTDVNSGWRRFSFDIAELADGIGFVVLAVGVFALGEIVANLGDPKSVRCSPPRWGVSSRRRTTSSDPAARSSGEPCSGRFSACSPAPGRPSPRSRPTWSKRRYPRTRRVSATVRSRAWRDPSPPTTRTRSASSSRCSRWGSLPAGRWR